MLASVFTFFPKKDTILDLKSRELTTEEARRILLGLGPERCNIIETVWLCGNKMTHVPLEVFYLFPNLEHLWCHKNRIVEFPNEMTRLTKLRSLTVDQNPVSQLPASYERLTRLDYLGTTDTMLPKWLQQGTHDRAKTQAMLRCIAMHNRRLYLPVRSIIIVLLGLRRFRQVACLRSIDKCLIRMVAKMIWAEKNDMAWAQIKTQ